MSVRGAGAALAVAALGLAGCGETEAASGSPPARERYAVAVAGAAADDGRLDAWRTAGRRALADPTPVVLPHRDRARLPAGEPAAHGFRFRLREGQVVEAKVAARDPETREGFFVELHRSGEDGSTGGTLLAETDATGVPLEHPSDADGAYVLRVQPELTAGGPYRVEIAVRSAYRFPVADAGPETITSRFGAPRDGGRRAHRGLDAVASRGTPAVAATRAIVRSVGTSPEGGIQVWLRDWDRRRDLYYAHLDEAWVSEGMVVEAGQPVGAVGTTGNAGVPHLHFGIYDLEGRPSDPLPWVIPPEALAPAPDEAG